VLPDAVEQILGRDLQTVSDPDDSRDPQISLAALSTPQLDRVHVALVRESFLRQLHALAMRTYVRAYLVLGLHALEHQGRSQ
jgi:hypothetical protein